MYFASQGCMLLWAAPEPAEPTVRVGTLASPASVVEDPPLSYPACADVECPKEWVCAGISAVVSVCVAAPPIDPAGLSVATSTPMMTRPVAIAVHVPTPKVMPGFVEMLE